MDIMKYFSHNITMMCSHALLVPPKISHFEFSKELFVGERTSVMCVAGSGDLPMKFEWFKNEAPIVLPPSHNGNEREFGGESISENNSIIIKQNDEFSSALTIYNISSKHSGEYSCQISNSAAVVRYSAFLEVNGIKNQHFFCPVMFEIIFACVVCMELPI
jgi:hypothetical protein